MQVNHSLRRIASLSAFVFAIGVTSASQAGVIPWVYDAIFGPVHYPSYGYSPYAVSYRRPVVIRSYAPAPYYSYAPASGCSSCSTSYYAPMVYSMPNSGCGSCGPVVMASPSGPCGAATYASSSQGCLSGCSATPASANVPATTKPVWKAQESNQGTSTTTVTPSAGTVTDDGLRTSPRSRGKANDDAGINEPVEVNRPANDDPEPTILKRNKVPAKIAEPEFEQPLENNKPTGTDKSIDFEFDLDQKKPGEARLRPPPALNLDSKIAWRTEPQRTTRVPFHAKLAKASVTRCAPGADSDWTPVVAKTNGLQIVRK